MVPSAANGPGDPEPCDYAIAAIQQILEASVPVFGICLGHQLLALAGGAETMKMKFGHHGANHPVQDLAGGQVMITSQNHGFAVDLWPLADGDPPERSGLAGPDLLPEKVDSDFGVLRPSHQNLNDGTLEGLLLEDVPAFSVQYHPEAAPGPSDAKLLFDDFATLIEEGR